MVSPSNATTPDDVVAASIARLQLDAIDPGYRALISRAAAGFRQESREAEDRVVHRYSSSGRGKLVIADSAGSLPGGGHADFVAGTTFDVLVRHANGTTDDDSIPDNRGASVRVFPSQAADGDEAALNAPRLDLVLSTGSGWMSRTAEHFLRWIAGSDDVRNAMAAEDPLASRNAWSILRHPAPLQQYVYYSKIAYEWTANDGSSYLARFRLRATDGVHDELGRVQAPWAPAPPELIARYVHETRARHFLHDDFDAELASRTIEYELEVQLRPRPPNDAQVDEALDARRDWSEAEFAWRSLASLSLSHRVARADADALQMNPGNTPSPALVLPAATSLHESASIGHARSAIYHLVAAARVGSDAALPPALLSLLPEAERNAMAAGVPRKHFAIIGGGISGLSCALELEEKGHRVTIFEREQVVGGKAASVTVENHAYDWGGHLCSSQYRNLLALVRRLGLEIETATGYGFIDAGDADAETVQACTLKFFELLNVDMAAEAGAPSFHSWSNKAWMPWRAWLSEPDKFIVRRRRKVKLLDTLMPVIEQLVSAGYGFTLDDDMPVLYLAKLLRMTDLLPTWTVRGGLSSVMNGMAAALKPSASIRVSTDVTQVRRFEHQVLIDHRPAHDEADAHTERFDAVVVACPLRAALQTFLEKDASEPEKLVLSKVQQFRYFTTIVKAEGLQRMRFHLVQSNCDGSDARGAITNAGHTVAYHHRYDDTDVFLFYSFAKPEHSLEDVKNMLVEDVTSWGGRVHEIMACREWAYFPYFSSADVQDGIYQRIDGMQGERNTYFTGSVFNFELMECNTAFSTDLMRRKVKPTSSALLRAASAQKRPKRRTVAQAAAEGGSRAVKADLAAKIKQVLAEVVNMDAGEIDASMPFNAYGLDSVETPTFAARVSALIGDGFDVSIAHIYDHPTVASLAASLASAAKQLPSSAPNLSSAELSSQIIAILADLLEMSPSEISPTMPFNAYGLDSVEAPEFAARVSALVGDAMDISIALVFENPNAEALAKVISDQLRSKRRQSMEGSKAATPAATNKATAAAAAAAAAASATASSLPKGTAEVEMASVAAARNIKQMVVMNVHNNARKPPLFMVHGGLGGVHNLKAVAARLECSVFGIQAEWMVEDAAKAVARDASQMQQIPQRYAEMIRAVQPQGPWRLAGYSAGGNIAVGIARELGQVSALLLLDTTAGYRGGSAGDDDTSDLDAAIAVDPEIAAIVKHTSRLIGTLAEHDTSVKLEAPTLLLKAAISTDHWRALVGPQDASHGFGALCSALTVEVVPGDHASLLNGSNAVSTASRMAAFLGVGSKVGGDSDDDALEVAASDKLATAALIVRVAAQKKLLPAAQVGSTFATLAMLVKQMDARPGHVRGSAASYYLACVARVPDVDAAGNRLQQPAVPAALTQLLQDETHSIASLKRHCVDACDRALVMMALTNTLLTWKHEQRALACWKEAETAMQEILDQVDSLQQYGFADSKKGGQSSFSMKFSEMASNKATPLDMHYMFAAALLLDELEHCELAAVKNAASTKAMTALLEQNEVREEIKRLEQANEKEKTALPGVRAVVGSNMANYFDVDAHRGHRWTRANLRETYGSTLANNLCPLMQRADTPFGLMYVCDAVGAELVRALFPAQLTQMQRLMRPDGFAPLPKRWQPDADSTSVVAYLLSKLEMTPMRFQPEQLDKFWSPYGYYTDLPELRPHHHVVSTQTHVLQATMELTASAKAGSAHDMRRRLVWRRVISYLERETAWFDGYNLSRAYALERIVTVVGRYAKEMRTEKKTTVHIEALHTLCDMLRDTTITSASESSLRLEERALIQIALNQAAKSFKEDVPKDLATRLETLAETNATFLQTQFVNSDGSGVNSEGNVVGAEGSAKATEALSLVPFDKVESSWILLPTIASSVNMTSAVAAAAVLGQ